MNLKSQKILGIDVTINTREEILEEIRKDLDSDNRKQITNNKKSQKPLVIFTPNPEIINYAQKDKDFKEIVNSVQINIPDGTGVVWALKKLYGITIPKITGIDFMLELVKLAEKESLGIGLIGGRGDLAVKTAECLKKSQPQLEIEVLEAPELEIQNSKLKIKQESDSEERYFISLNNEIRKKRIDILFVALGHPKQEYFISQLSVVSCQLSERPLVMMAVGGSFDYISGKVLRAPEWIRNRGFEWVYRLIREPWRLGRQLKGAEFFWKILTS